MLDRIVGKKKLEVAALYGKMRFDRLPHAEESRFLHSLRLDGPRVRLIAEIKKASPSKGVLCPHFDPETLACAYAENGAAAISVLTDTEFFQGDSAYVPLTAQLTGLPVLRKDFIIDEIQLTETRQLGASAVLLIAAILDDKALNSLIVSALAMNIEPLVEVHNREELKRALDTPARVIGVNNRNLRDFTVALSVSLDLAGDFPDSITRVSESGIRTPADLLRLEEYGYHGALVGESLVTSPDIPAMVRSLAYYREVY